MTNTPTQQVSMVTDYFACSLLFHIVVNPFQVELSDLYWIGEGDFVLLA